TELRMFRKLTVILALAMIMFIAAILGLSTQYATATSDKETNYTFETVPVESIEITVDGDLRDIQPRQEFTLSYVITPWYTTTSEIYFDVMPRSAAVVSEVSKVNLIDGIAQGTAIITVSPDVAVGSTFTVSAGVDGIESNTIEMTVEKIPVKGISLSAQGTDDKLHIGKTRTVQCEFLPSYASVQDVRYELSGSGMKYIENFDETSGTITARGDVSLIDVNSTVTITAYSVDNPNAFDSVTLTLYMPTTIVEISAATPLGRFNSDGNALAVASSIAGDTVSLSATINGVDSTGLNYIIVKGQEYVENGYVRSDGTFELRPTSNWSESMKIPHAEVKIRAAYSDGFDEITVSVYVPLERISFVNPVVSNVENFRSYDMQVEAFPKYATLLADNDEPICYSLNGIDGAIATVDGNGLLSLPKSLTSKGSIINYSANLTNEWIGVDVQPLTKDLTVMPVYAKNFNSIKITKNGLAIDDRNVKALPSDNLQLDIVYNVDNVTDIDVTLSEDSDIISTVGSSISVFALNAMHEDNPFIEITVNYNHGGNVFAEKCYLSIYVPALSAEIADVAFHRDRDLNLSEIITINGHGYASNKTIEWGTPTVINGKAGITATCENGMLRIDSNANAGMDVRIPYKTFDSDTWQYKEFSVAALDGNFNLIYGDIWSGKDNRSYKVDANAPQLEEGQSVDLKLNYEGFGGRTKYGLTYSVEVSSSNATLVFKSYEESVDIFTLSAKSGQSGQNNYITYKITVYDGDATYYVYSDGMSVPDSIVNGLLSKKIAIFKRISGTLGVSENYVEVYYSFTLTGWDPSFTFNQNDLKWELSNGGTMNENIFAASPDCGFVLSIKADQKYNDSTIGY
ncbi:MAG: hypothetical protein K2J13_01525, partial [Clostridia bacterium]|nr:hypothetical protein [Clostridia bacterium]